MTSKELLKKVRKIELRAKGLSNEAFSGTYKTSFKGRGMSFSEVRPYQYGDDVRNIDWNVTARTNEPHVKVFEEERELTFMLLLDVSGSAFFGTQQQPKNEYAAELAATLAFSAIANNDKVGAIFFSDKIEKYLPPKKGKSHILRIIRELLYLKPENSATNLGVPLKYLTALIKKRCTAFVISDFMTKGYEDMLKVAANRHDLVGVRLFDPRERELPDVGLLPMRDMETGQVRWVDTSSVATRARYEQWYTEHAAFFKGTFLKSGADILNLEVGEPYIKALIQFFKER